MQKESEETIIVEKKIYILCHEENSNEMLKAFDAAYGTHIADVNCGVISRKEGRLQKRI